MNTLSERLPQVRVRDRQKGIVRKRPSKGYRQEESSSSVVFDLNTIMVVLKHVPKARKLLVEWWPRPNGLGITVQGTDGTLYFNNPTIKVKPPIKSTTKFNFSLRLPGGAQKKSFAHVSNFVSIISYYLKKSGYKTVARKGKGTDPGSGRAVSTTPIPEHVRTKTKEDIHSALKAKVKQEVRKHKLHPTTMTNIQIDSLLTQITELLAKDLEIQLTMASKSRQVKE